MIATVRIELPFYLSLEDPIRVPYAEVCDEPRVPELADSVVEIGFDYVQRRIDKSGMLHARTVVRIEVASDQELAREAVGAFAIRDCLRIVNRVIACYQAVTGQFSNSGYITPLGLSDMQLFADIRVDGESVRDRWPGHSISTFPLSAEHSHQFERYLAGQPLPLPRLFLTSARLMVNRGQYSLSVVQAAAAVELRLTEYVSQKLEEANAGARRIRNYQRKTLGQKLGFSSPDDRSLETYCASVAGFPELFTQLKDPLNRLRNDVIHRGHMASLEESRDITEIASRFLGSVP